MSTLIENLVAFRDAQAKKEGIENYKVLQYPTIEAIATALPNSLPELSKIKGIGPTKLKKYGESILALVRAVEEPVKEYSSTQTLPLDEAEKQVISVSEYVEYLNIVLQKTADVKIHGEITSSKEYPSGVYFTLKDMREESVLSCFIPLYTYRGTGFAIEEGMEVRIEGVPRMVKRNGRFQFTVEKIELAGAGALKKAYELLKQKLETEGVFTRKRDLPECISRIGLVTSKSGAVIHDFKNNLDARGLKLFLKDVRVEGVYATRQVIDAIQYFNKADLRVDCLVIMRGGGSLEDLQTFNSEEVVRAVFASNIPTISAIGHDTDVPLVCLAADAYTSTPTAAAVLINKSWNQAEHDFADLTQTLLSTGEALCTKLAQDTARLSDILFGKLQSMFEKSKYVTLLIHTKIREYITWVQVKTEGLQKMHIQLFEGHGRMLQTTEEKIVVQELFIKNSDPTRNLKLGYSIAKTKNGNVVRNIDEVQVLEDLSVQVLGGFIETTVKGKKYENKV